MASLNGRAKLKNTFSGCPSYEIPTVIRLVPTEFRWPRRNAFYDLANAIPRTIDAPAIVERPQN
jgi:hypothetical protein